MVYSPQYKGRVIRAFANTPHNFEIVFSDTTGFDGDDARNNDNVDTVEKAYSSVARLSSSDTITITILGNLSPVSDHSAPKIPMTPWIIAHKVGHTFQALSRKRNVSCIADVKKVDDIIYYISLWASYKNKKDFNPFSALPRRKTKLFSYQCNIADIMTSKSHVLSHYEIFQELLAQYLLRGKVTLKAGDYLQSLVDDLNKAFFTLFDNLKGYNITAI